MTYYVGVDTGGTFTDLVLIDDDGTLSFDKAFSTPHDPGQGVLAALANASEHLGQDTPSLLRATGRFAHGTTVATNALIQRRGARVGLLMTAGFEDTTLITRGPMGKNMGIPIVQALDYAHNERPEPIVPRQRIQGVVERIAPDGMVICPLRDESVIRALEHFRGLDVESIAVCLLWAFRNEAHERRIKALAAEHAPGIPISISSETSPLLGEYARAMTTVVNAYVGPVLHRYIGRLSATLAEGGLAPAVQLMKCSGGVTLPQHVERQAVSLVNSGPVGGLVAARVVGESLGYQNIITSDMGGTSFDVGVIHGGAYTYEQTPFLDQGVPAQTPALRVATIGAGGGSIAWSDGRRLQVGPQSAGSVPGPACYGAGGTEPTVTDALVVLGILDPNHFFGGRKVLDRSLAEAAIHDRVAAPLGVSVQEAAAGIYEIVTATMGDLIRSVTVESGHDPREFALFAYGGASPAHAALYADGLGVREVVVPYTSSVFSALGCVLSDVTYTYARSEPMPLEPSPATLERSQAIFAELEALALEDMRSLGYAASQVSLSRRLEVRYEGQMNELTVQCAEGPVSAAGVAAVRDTFEAIYETRFGPGTSRPESPMEIITFRVEALHVTAKPALRPLPDGPADPAHARTGTREVYLRRAGALPSAIYDGDRLTPGNVVSGPAVIERRDTTVFVPPRHAARMDGYRNLRITRNGQE